jgi:rare lipoprotein A
MRSNNKLALAGALALGGCGGGWWHDQPAAAPVPAAAPAGDASYGGQAGYPQGGDQFPVTPQYPAGAEPVTTSGQDYGRSGAAYPPPKPERQPKRRPEPTPPADTGYVPPPQNAVRYDNVGVAAWSAEPGTVAGAHATLPPGSFVEVTALDTGKTILVPITAQSRPGREIELSGAAAQELGLGMGGAGEAGVRVRATNPTGADIGALKAGRPAPPRPDTPPVLLNALRRKLAGTQGQVGQPPYVAPQPMPPAPATRPPPRPPVATRPAPVAPAAPATGGAGYYVQVAAIADAQRATAIAREVGGSVSSSGGLVRVRFGPFDDLATAQAARDDVARRGYGDARIVRQD